MPSIRPFVKWSKQTRKRFYSHVKPEGECLVWTAYRDKGGYGKCRMDVYGSRCAHRAAYIQKHGPTKLVIDHLCRNRACVKLSHLEAVTQHENCLRGVVTRRTETHCANGHEINEKNSNIGARGYFYCRVCLLESYYRNCHKYKKKVLS